METKKIIYGEVFDKKFKIQLNENLNYLKFKLLNTGISFALNMAENSKSIKTSGSIKGKILTSNFKSNFIYDETSINFYNLYFRNRDLSFDSEGFIKLKSILQYKFAIRNKKYKY